MNKKNIVKSVVKAMHIFEEMVNYGKMEYPDLYTYKIGPCGDIVFLYLLLGKEESIEDLKFHYIGCPALSSSCSALTLLVIGKKINEAMDISADEILEYTEGLPKDHYHCPVLAVDTLKKMIKSYQESAKLTKLEHDNYVHFCGFTGLELENLEEVPCSNCPTLKECERDHIIIK